MMLLLGVVSANCLPNRLYLGGAGWRENRQLAGSNQMWLKMWEQL